MRRTRVVLAAIGCLLLAGCVRMPTEGPVYEPEVSTDVDGQPGFAFDPRPPQAGATADEIVTGFLEAMRATPVSLTVAREFLSREAAEKWQPEQQIITYSELGSPAGSSRVRVPMTDINVYDARGAWQRTQAARVLSLGVVEEDGEWRIDEVPDALVVPDSWFDDSDGRASLTNWARTTRYNEPGPGYGTRGYQ